MSPPIRGDGEMDFAAGAAWAESYRDGWPAVGSLVKLDPSTLRVLDRFRPPTFVTSIAATKAGLWVGGVDRLWLLDPTTDRIVRSVPVDNSVWVAYATGLQGTANRFTLPDLVEYPPKTGEDLGRNGLRVFATSDLLWVDTGFGDLSCDDPITGVARDHLTEQSWGGSGVVTSVDGEVYRVIGQRFERLLPGAACVR